MNHTRHVVVIQCNLTNDAESDPVLNEGSQQLIDEVHFPDRPDEGGIMMDEVIRSAVGNTDEKQIIERRFYIMYQVRSNCFNIIILEL